MIIPVQTLQRQSESITGVELDPDSSAKSLKQSVKHMTWSEISYTVAAAKINTCGKVLTQQTLTFLTLDVTYMHKNLFLTKNNQSNNKKATSQMF